MFRFLFERKLAGWTLGFFTNLRIHNLLIMLKFPQLIYEILTGDGKSNILLNNETLRNCTPNVSQPQTQKAACGIDQELHPQPHRQDHDAQEQKHQHHRDENG